MHYGSGFVKCRGCGEKDILESMQEAAGESKRAESTESHENLDAKKALLVNALNWFVRGRIAQTPLDRLFAFDALRMLGEQLPEQDKIIRELNSIQSDEGTWKKGHEHYVPTTAQALLFYKRSGETPKKSLEPFLSTIDTWEKVTAHNDRYQPGNHWGGLWGYVGCYTALGKRPPWADKFLEEARGRFDEWAQDNHQRSHVIDCFRQLGEPIPRAEELTALTLQGQMPDGRWATAGHWNPALPQTAFGIATLKILKPQGSPETDEAIGRGLKFIDQSFKVIQREGKEYGGYLQEPDDLYPDPLATSLAIIAQLHPEQLEELTGYNE
ncbi:MAG: hypothetical protein WAP52_01140 [Candidatus Sungiibacteriota bacterium]